MGETKRKILQILYDTSLDTKEIINVLRDESEFVRFNEETVRKHLRDLKSMNKIVNERVGHLYVWTLV